MPDKAKISVLIADDQRIMRLGLTTILENFPDIEPVGEAENGDAAVKLAIDLAPNVVLMDLTMPGMGGIEAVKQIKAAAPHVRIIILTESGTDETALLAFAAGVDGYCLKETNAVQLGLIIRTVNEGIACLDLGIASRFMAVKLATTGLSNGNKTPIVAKA